MKLVEGPPPFPMSEEVQHELLLMAFECATDSPDPSTQNGAVIVNQAIHVLGMGWNQFPEGVGYSDERWERPLKYSFIEHAERYSIFDAARSGHGTDGATMVCPWASCAECARAIACAGITRLVRLAFPEDGTGDRWRASCEIGDTILRESGVEIVEFAGQIEEIEPIRRDGQLWHP